MSGEQQAYTRKNGPTELITPIGTVDYPGQEACGLDFHGWCDAAKANGGFVPADLVGFSMSVYGEAQREAYCRKVEAAGGKPCPDLRRETSDAHGARIARELAAQREAASARQPERLGYTACGPAVESVLRGDIRGCSVGEGIESLLKPSAYGAAQQLRAPGKTFTRSEILAVLKSRKAVLDGRPAFHAAVRELEMLADIFERME